MQSVLAELDGLRLSVPMAAASAAPSALPPAAAPFAPPPPTTMDTLGGAAEGGRQQQRSGGEIFAAIEGLGQQLQQQGGLAPMMEQLQQTMAANPRFSSNPHPCRSP